MAQHLVGGLASGSAFALLALALVLVLKTTNVPNFAMAEMALLPTFIAWSLVANRVPYVVAVAVGLLAAGTIGVIVERTTIRTLIGRPHHVTVVMTIGVWIFLNSVTGLIWGSDARSIAFPWSRAIAIGTAVVTTEQVVLIAAAAVVAIALLGFFRTRWGIFMKAVAVDPQVPRLVGIDVGRLSSLSWAMASAIAGVGVFLHTQATVLSIDSGNDLILNGFVAAAVGGFSSVPGAVVGGLILGVVEAAAGAYISPAAQLGVALVAILAILVVRPQGVLGESLARDV